MHKKEKSREFLGKLFGPLLKTGLILIGNVFKPLAKSVFIPLGLIAAGSVTDAAIHKIMFRSDMATLAVSNEEMNVILKVVKSLEESGLLIKGDRDTIKHEATKQKQAFLGILPGASLLRDLLTGRGTKRTSADTIIAGQER